MKKLLAVVFIMAAGAANAACLAPVGSVPDESGKCVCPDGTKSELQMKNGSGRMVCAASSGGQEQAQEQDGAGSKKSYKIIFDPKWGKLDGSIFKKKITCDEGSTFAVAGEPVRDGYDFQGWKYQKRDRNGGRNGVIVTVAAGSAENCGGDYSVDAVWKKNEKAAPAPDDPGDAEAESPDADADPDETAAEMTMPAATSAQAGIAPENPNDKKFLADFDELTAIFNARVAEIHKNNAAAKAAAERKAAEQSRAASAAAGKCPSTATVEVLISTPNGKTWESARDDAKSMCGAQGFDNFEMLGDCAKQNLGDGSSCNARCQCARKA